MLVLNLPFKALMFLTLMRPYLVLFLVLWLKLVKDFLKVRCRLALLPFLISCLIWLDFVASLPLGEGRAGRPTVVPRPPPATRSPHANAPVHDRGNPVSCAPLLCAHLRRQGRGRGRPDPLEEDGHRQGIPL